ncbi:magnesium transporter, partial [bacterium]|nr:magnesium transporter [bacterium]
MAETQHDPPIEESLLQAVFQSLDNRHLNQTISALDGPTLKALVDRANEQQQAEKLLEPLSKKNLAKVLSTDFPAASAELLQQLPEKDQVKLLQKISPTLGATILERFPDDRASRIFEMLVDRQLDTSVALIKKLRTDTWVDLVQSLSPAHRSLVLEALEPEDYSVAEELMSFSPDTAGGLMHKEFIAIHGRFTTADIVRHLRRHARKYSGYFTRYFFVVGSMNDLQGVVSLEQILFGEAKKRVKELAKEISLTVEPAESADHLVRLFRTHGFAAIPVVDEERKLLGIVTQDTALKHAETSSEGKLLKMAGIVAGEEFRDMPFRARSWNRLSWLSVNIFLNL